MSQVLSQYQLDELKVQAQRLVTLRKLEEHPWELAWSGYYPKTATKIEVYEEWVELKQKVERIISGEKLFEDEYTHVNDYVRISFLEDCKTIDIWNLISTD